MTSPPATPSHTASRRHAAWGGAWSVPSAYATRFGSARVRVRVAAPEDLDLAVALAERRIPARLELPTSLYGTYRRRRLGPHRVVEVERHSLDQPVEALDVDLVDDLVRRRQTLFVPASPTAAEATCRLTALGLPIALDRPRRWPAPALQEIAATLHAGNPDAPLPEPLAGLHRALPDREPIPLRDAYGEGKAPCWFVTAEGWVARSPDHAEAGAFLGSVDTLADRTPSGEAGPLPEACAACAALATCGGYWLAVDVQADTHCDAWRDLCTGPDA